MVAMGLRDGRWSWRSEKNRRSDSVALRVGARGAMVLED